MSISTFERDLNSLLVETFNYILRYEETILKEKLNFSVTVTEAHFLEAVGKMENGATVSEIAAALHITLPTATVAIKKLESKGLVTKTSCPEDARRLSIKLTHKGKRIYMVHKLFHRKMVKNISREFPALEKEILLNTMQKLSEYFKQKVEMNI